MRGKGLPALSQCFTKRVTRAWIQRINRTHIVRKEEKEGGHVGPREERVQIKWWEVTAHFWES